MKVYDLHGKEYKLDVRATQYPLRPREGSKSIIQYECGQLIKQKFPLEVILEEVNIPGLNLKIDFLLPKKRLAFEIQGAQHDKFSKFFHGSLEGFKASRERDHLKKQWCAANNIELHYVYKVEDFSAFLGINDDTRKTAQ